MTMSSSILWRQEDRETDAEKERRLLHKAQGALQGIWAIVETQLDEPFGHRTEPAMLGRVVKHLTTALNAAQTLIDAYEYHLARCLEASLSPETAATAWQLHSSEVFEAELIEAESYGPNFMRLVDETILAPLGIGPHDRAQA
jgi:hypothetical protein